MDAEVDIRLGLESIEETAFERVEDAALFEQLTPEGLGMQFFVHTDVDAEADRLSVSAGVKYVFESTEIVRLEARFAFLVGDLGSHMSIDQDSKTVTFEIDIIPMLLQISMGALRGMLFERVSDTSLKRFPLPLVDMEEVIKRNTFHVKKNPSASDRGKNDR